jgi:hypothetical protein
MADNNIGQILADGIFHDSAMQQQCETSFAAAIATASSDPAIRAAAELVESHAQRYGAYTENDGRPVDPTAILLDDLNALVEAGSARSFEDPRNTYIDTADGGITPGENNAYFSAAEMIETITNVDGPFDEMADHCGLPAPQQPGGRGR